ncbi:MAG: glycosyltransferase [Anaerolineales bacterium]|nr:glycosyltransferase [Anaerolineales bacterium]
MTRKKNFVGSILMLSLHGYVGVEPEELGKPDTGGQVVFVLELAKRFSRLGYRVDLVTRRFEKRAQIEEINEGLHLWRIPFGGEKFIRKEDMHDHVGEFVTNFLAAVRSRKIQYDVVNSHYWDAGWAGQKIAEELYIPHVHTPHSLGGWKQQEMDGDPEELEKTYRFEERIRREFLIYRSCDHIIATTEEQLKMLTSYYDLTERHIAVIPPGIDENRFTPIHSLKRQQLRERFGIKAPTIYAVGRMATNKGYDLLIQSLPVVRKLVPQMQLLLAAGGDDSQRDKEKEEELKNIAQQVGVFDAIQWAQYIPEEELANYYRATDVFSLSSRYEPFGMTAVEAMACGTPTVVTVNGGLHELIDFGTQALFADPNCPEEYGAILALPLRYPRLAEELSIEGSRFSRRNFGWTGIAKRTLNIFDQFKGKYAPPELE